MSKIFKNRKLKVAVIRCSLSRPNFIFHLPTHKNVVCIYTWIQTWTGICTSTHNYTNIHKQKKTHSHNHTHAYTYMCACVCVSECVKDSLLKIYSKNKDKHSDIRDTNRRKFTIFTVWISGDKKYRYETHEVQRKLIKSNNSLSVHTHHVL